MQDVEENNVGVAKVIDPTKNVLDLVRAESKYQDAMRAAVDRYHEAMREKDQQRRDDLATQRDHYEERIARMLTENLNKTTDLLARQLEKSDANSSERFGKLEQFRWETGGKATGLADVRGMVTFLIGAVLSGLLVWAAIKAL